MLLIFRWYFGNISGDEARQFLHERGSVGSYLVRESRTNPGFYVLSVRFVFFVMQKFVLVTLSEVKCVNLIAMYGSTEIRNLEVFPLKKTRSSHGISKKKSMSI